MVKTQLTREVIDKLVLDIAGQLVNKKYHKNSARYGNLRMNIYAPNEILGTLLRAFTCTIRDLSITDGDTMIYKVGFEKEWEELQNPGHPEFSYLTKKLDELRLLKDMLASSKTSFDQIPTFHQYASVARRRSSYHQVVDTFTESERMRLEHDMWFKHDMSSEMYMQHCLKEAKTNVYKVNPAFSIYEYVQSSLKPSSWFNHDINWMLKARYDFMALI